MKLEFKGGKELEAALAELGDPKAMRRAAMAALRQSANVVRDETRNQAPVLTGRLAKSVRVKSFRGSDGKPSMQVTIVGDAAIKKSGDKETDSENLTKGGRGFVARFLEYGTKRMQPHPFFRPAFDMSVQRALSRLGTSLWAQIEKQSQRLKK